ncbi:hypothetical protein RUM43_009269, partial [Polyplax serrata]
TGDSSTQVPSKRNPEIMELSRVKFQRKLIKRKSAPISESDEGYDSARVVKGD